MREKGHSKNVTKKLFTNKNYPHHRAVFIYSLLYNRFYLLVIITLWQWSAKLKCYLMANTS